MYFYIGHPELVGEFLQCLIILGYNEEWEQDYKDIYKKGVDYLLGKETQCSTFERGHWQKSRRTEYDAYHAVYCAVVGLMQHGPKEVPVSPLLLNDTLGRSWWQEVEVDAIARQRKFSHRRGLRNISKRK